MDTAGSVVLGLDSNSAAERIDNASVCGATSRVLTPSVSLLQYNSYTGSLDYSQQDETTIGTHSFTLSRSLVNYPDVTDSTTISLTVSCPTKLLSSSLVTSIQSTLEYDLALRKKVEVELPNI